jgi:AcrR family transcriptional regulator
MKGSMVMSNIQEPVDLRIRRTHKLLWEALLTLMTEQEFETISVKEICDRAMVHRTTFYKHYEDKYDLLTRGMEHTHEMMLTEVKQAGSSSYTRFFEHVASHERFYRAMLCGTGVGSFQTRLRNYFADNIAREMQHPERAGYPPLVPPSLLAHFYAGAVVNAITWWLLSDVRPSPEQMGDYMRSLLGKKSPEKGGVR